MCLLVVLHRLLPGAPLVVAANRDEWLARPTEALGVLRERDPRLLGGRDLTAGGTWMAVGEHGVFAALTNRPAQSGRDPSRRSRGELPLLGAGAVDAAAGARALAEGVRGEDYNPCWLLVGDRAALFYLEVEAGAPVPVPLGPGLHVLENRPLGAASPKAAFVEARARYALDRALAAVDPAWSLGQDLASLLASHEVPADADPARLREAQAACVHAGPYGTRSAMVVLVPAAGAPRLHFSDGPPCTAPWSNASF